MRPVRSWFGVAVAMVGFVVFVGAAYPNPVPRIGLISWTSCEAALAAKGEWASLLKALNELRYRPQENIIVECRSANGRVEQFGSAANELIKIPVDIIVGNSDLAVNAAGTATHTIPVVGVHSLLFGNSYSAPRVNVTGVGNISLELTGKRLEMLKKAVPQIHRLAVLSNPVGFYRADEMRTRRAGDELGTELVFFRVRELGGLAPAFAEMKAQGVDAVFILPDLMFAENAKQIAELALSHGLATMVADQRMTEAGCLISYSSKSAEFGPRLATFVDRILNGSEAGNLPFERPNSFVLSINLRTASALGITLPRDLLLMANEVVE